MTLVPDHEKPLPIDKPNLFGAIATGLILSFALGVLVTTIFVTAPASNRDETIVRDDLGVYADADVRTAIATEGVYVWTVVGAIGNAISVLAIYFAYRAFRESQSSTRAAIRANDLHQEVAERQLRAYLEVSNPVCRWEEHSERMIFEWVVSNRGQTPSLENSVQFSMVLGEHEPNQTPHDFNLEQAIRTPFIGPGRDFEFDKSYPGFTKDAIRKIMQGELFLSFAIWIKYQDLFSNDRNYVVYLGQKVEFFEPMGVSKMHFAESEDSWLRSPNPQIDD